MPFYCVASFACFPWLVALNFDAEFYYSRALWNKDAVLICRVLTTLTMFRSDYFTRGSLGGERLYSHNSWVFCGKNE